MLESLFDAFAVVTSAQHAAFLVIGVVIGLAVGIFPGLGGIGPVRASTVMDAALIQCQRRTGASYT